MLATRDDIFVDYTRTGFESAFSEYFTIEQVVPVRETARVMYVMSKRKP